MVGKAHLQGVLHGPTGRRSAVHLGQIGPHLGQIGPDLGKIGPDLGKIVTEILAQLGQNVPQICGRVLFQAGGGGARQKADLKERVNARAVATGVHANRGKSTTRGPKARKIKSLLFGDVGWKSEFRRCGHLLAKGV